MNSHTQTASKIAAEALNIKLAALKLAAAPDQSSLVALLRDCCDQLAETASTLNDRVDSLQDALNALDQDECECGQWFEKVRGGGDECPDCKEAGESYRETERFLRGIR